MDFQEFMQSEGAQAFLTPNANPLQAISGARRLLAAFIPMANALFEDCWAACQNTQAIVGVTLLPGCHIAEKLNVPSFQVAFYPFSPTSEFAVPLLPLKNELPPLFNRLTYSLAQGGGWLVLRRAVNNWRKQLGLDTIKFETSFSYMRRKRVPYLYGFSPTLVPKPSDWPDWFYVTGPWFLKSPSRWQPPKELTAFIENGPPPLYVGFGSMADRQATQRTKVIIQALGQTKQRAVVFSGWGGVETHDLPETVFQTGSIPHEWLFPRMAAIIHHGGAGTTIAAAKSGVPSMVIPFLGDQFFWGRRIAKIGIGPSPIPMRELAVTRLTRAIEQMLSDRAMRARAQEVGQKIQAEDGVQKAVQVIERHAR
jgi:UDP:flavonoid glycosyltransferase YjiC (YdhE family)